MKSKASKILYALLRMICFNNGMLKNEIWGFWNLLCASVNDKFQCWNVGKMKSEAFNILYALLRIICFIDGMLKKWNLRLLKSSMPFFKILYALIKIILFIDGMLKKWNLRGLKSFMHIWKWYGGMLERWKNEIWGF